jgi:Fe-S cluster assembly iron-binding protein IscA
MLAITDKARDAFRELAADENASISVLRIVMMGFG